MNYGRRHQFDIQSGVLGRSDINSKVVEEAPLYRRWQLQLSQHNEFQKTPAGREMANQYMLRQMQNVTPHEDRLRTEEWNVSSASIESMVSNLIKYFIKTLSCTRIRSINLVYEVIDSND